MKIVIIQPSFLPWRGYFHLIKRSDIFVFYDDVQYDKNSWRNRNIIKTGNGSQWITVPVLAKNKFGQKINEAMINNCAGGIWRKKIWNAICYSYSKAEYFNEFLPFLKDIFSKEWHSLSELDIYAIIKICDLLGIKRKFYRSSELAVQGERVSRLVGICKKLGGTHYISGPSAKNYIMNDEDFTNNGIKLEFHNYDYPAYKQLYRDFIPNVSVIDLLFNCGKDSFRYIWNNEQDD